MSWAEARKIQETIEEKTSIKIQTVTFSFSSSSAPYITDTDTIDIDEVDIEKTIIVPISYVNVQYLNSLSYGFDNNSTVYCERTVQENQRRAFSVTVQIITFGANVSKE